MPLPLKIHLTVFAVSVVAGIVLSYAREAQTLSELCRRLVIAAVAVFMTAAVGADLLVILHDALIFIGFDVNNPATWTDTGIILLAIVLTVWPFFVIHWVQSLIRGDDMMSSGIDLDRIRVLKPTEGTTP